MAAFVSCTSLNVLRVSVTCGSSSFVDRIHVLSPPKFALRQRCTPNLHPSRLRVLASSGDVNYNEFRTKLKPDLNLSSRSSEYKTALKEILVGVRELAMPLYNGKHKFKAWMWTIATIALALLTTMYAVALSMIQKLFWNCLNTKNVAQFGKLMLLYAVAVTVGPIVISTFKWVQERLALLWRTSLTNNLLSRYFSSLNYYKISIGVGDIDNPDQRISEDVKLFTTRAVRFITILGESFFDLIVFSVILFRVYKPLLLLLIVYSAVGTIAISLAGRKLLVLNRQQVTREANFRFGLVRVRESTESIAFYGGEKSEETEITSRFGSLFRNKISLIGLQRTVSFLSTSFRYWVQIAPTAVLAPQYFAGNIQLGTISQVYFSFNHVLGSLGLLVAEFSSLAEFGAGIRRLKSLSDVLGPKIVLGDPFRKSNEEQDNTRANGLELKNVSVCTPTLPHRTLVKNIDLNVGLGERVLVVGRSGVGKSSLMRTICGLWNQVEGQISRPMPEDTLFLPQRPFVMLGSLRENVLYPKLGDDISDEDIQDALERVNLGYLASNMGGLDASGEVLGRCMSIGEQQRLGFARILISRPSFVVLDESSSALDLENERDMYNIIAKKGITCISVGNRPSLVDFHDKILELEGEGNWKFEPRETFVRRKEKESIHI